MNGHVLGLPGVRSDRQAQPRKILTSLAGALFAAGGGIIDGAESRDIGNSSDIDKLRAGLLMGRITSGGKWAPSILGVTDGAYSDGETNLEVTPATAVEIVRRIGATGDLTVTGPATAGTAVSSATKTYSAVNVTTGDITIADMDDDFISGSLVQAADGSETIRSLLVDQWGIKVTDRDGDDIDVPYAEILIAGQIDASQIINYTSDAAIKAWIKTQLRVYGIGFVFDDDLTT